MPIETPFDAYQAIRDVLVDVVGLRADLYLFGGRQQPSPLKHRSFRMNLGRFRLGVGNERGQPGDVLHGEERITLHLAHELAQGAHDKSVELAFADVLAVADALLTSDRTRGTVRIPGDPVASGTRTLVGSFVETDLELGVRWDMTLSARRA